MIHARALPLENHPQSASVMSIYHTLTSKGHTVVLAGGAVRDWLRGEIPQDIDIVSSATPDEIAELFPQTVPVGKSFGVMIVVVGGHSFEVATFRKEHGYEDGRHPQSVEWGTPEQDAERRDFTVNGLFYEPGRKEIWDFIGGLKDLESKVLRAIGRAEDRFREDHLRVLRAYRFAAQLGFRWDAELEKALQKTSSLLPSVSQERIREELIKTFDSPFRAPVIKTLDENQVLATLFPEYQWPLSSYEPWSDTFEEAGLLELSYWHWHAQPSKQKLDEFLKKLKLSRRQGLRVRRALTLFVESDVWGPSRDGVEKSPVGKIVENLFDEDFRRGFFHLMKLLEGKADLPGDLDSTAWRKKLNLALSLYKKWGEKPAPYLAAKDLDFLSGPPLGEALRQALWRQLEGKTRNEVFDWIKNKFSSPPLANE